MGNENSALSLHQKRQIVRDAQFSEADVKRLYWRFKQLDVNGKDAIPLQSIVNMAGMDTNPLVERISEVFDTNSDGTISFNELLVGVAKVAQKASQLEKTRFVFDVYDSDKDGHISNADLFGTLKTMVGNNLTDSQLHDLVNRTISSGDKDGDGMLSFHEFQCVGSLPASPGRNRHTSFTHPQITPHIDFGDQIAFKF